MAAVRTSRELDVAFKLDVVRHLYGEMTGGKLSRGAIYRAAAIYKVHRVTVGKIWRDCHAGRADPQKKGRCGRKKIYTQDAVTEIVKEVPQKQHTTMRDLVEASGLSMGTIERNTKLGTLRRSSSRLKPLLTETNQLMRLIFSCSHVQRSTPSTIEETNETSALENCQFLDMMDIVHLDEKWFNADKKCRKVYLTKNEEVPKRSCKSTRFLPKVMFL
ncbi:hypothetical protein Ae201684P_015971 [Aphanomyces euteiches]|uniref:Transposase Tc1-like domain-containing protein n=1 Tax=Aphanomyces euteiches TaxID=100861 RepID=A0A6G0W6N7_9STRA|nr:hypothetical protein Ae201684_018154 [Aphanomyces euteiches]KAH9074073.1 hypothetical protein Ae201684P_015971 [Aphanomyces euteiches]